MVGKFQELGVASDYNPSWGLRQDEFIVQLRGTQGIKKYREMAENDPVIGAILMSMDMMLRSVKWRIEGGTEKGRSYVESEMHGMADRTWEEFISDVLSFLPYGFSLFEIVMKRRADGLIGLKKLAPRAQWTVDRFTTNENGDILGVWQVAAQRNVFIPYSKLLHFRTSAINNEPAGRSVLRSAFTSWRYQNEIKYIEAVAIERELNGLPIARVPSEYMGANASDSQKAFMASIKRIVRDVKRNEQGYIILPSDLYADDDGKLSNKYLVEFDLIASKGTRDIDTSKTILRYQGDMARAVMADFVMLGSNDRGSFALSKSKADLFLKALEGFMDTIQAVLNRRLLPRLWEVNAGLLSPEDMPHLARGRVAPVDLDELGQFVQRLTMAGADLFPDDGLDKHLRDIAGLPEGDPNRPTPNADLAGGGTPDGAAEDE
jgi:hypothetical protein